MLITKAIHLAAEVHSGQVDKAGVEYILHPLAVMQLVDLSGKFITDNDRTNIRCAALLHDTLEDCQGGPAEVLELRGYIEVAFGRTIYAAVDALTKRAKLSETYEEYIERLAQNWIARRVKIADLTHNMDPSRMPDREITQRDFERWEKYRRALVRLERY